MKFTCTTCQCIFNKKLTLLEKELNYTPKFCSKECAIAWKVVENKKYIKDKKIGNRQSSKEEMSFGKIIKEHFTKLVPQYQLKGYEHHYDFYSPELNLLLEYNGTFWHNKLNARVKDKYHINEATKRGVYIAIITDIDWKKFVEDGLPDRASLVKFLNSRIKNIEN